MNQERHAQIGRPEFGLPATVRKRNNKQDARRQSD
jgi:hypothetical protein